MMMSASSESRNYGRFDELAEEFAERFRRGERPSLNEYIDRLPEMADEIRAMFPAMLEVERAEQDVRGEDEQESERRAPPRAQIGDYRLLREVGRGGMGVVYEAEQVSLGRRVALKVLPGHVAGDRRALERFRREAKAAARLHHTNIVPVFEVGRDGDVAFYAMQFIQGQGLDQVISELARIRDPARAAAERTANSRASSGGAIAGATPTLGVAVSGAAGRELNRVAESLLSGRLGAMCRDDDAPAEQTDGLARTEWFDVNATTGPSHAVLDTGFASGLAPPGPETSAVLPGGTPVSAVETSGRRQPYFRSVAQIARQAAQGLAYAHARGVVHRDIKPSNLLLDTSGVVWITDFGLAKADDDGLTATGDILGTLRYMAPERLRGDGDGRADIYALGLTLYELLTLRPAFDPSDRLKLIERIKAEEPVRPRTLDARIPRDLETIVLKSIEKDPGRRYPTAEALSADLRRFLDDEPIQARRASLIERYARWARHHPTIAIVGAVVTAILVLATAVSLVAMERFREQAKQQFLIAGEREVQRSRAELRRVEAETARAEALVARRHDENTLVDMHAARGLVAAEQGDSARAMLWFAHAAALAQHDKERERINRVRARAWERMMTVPVRAFDHGGKLLTTVAMHPRGELLLTVTEEGRLRLWRIDAGREEKALIDAPVLSAAWSPDGRRLALGMARGGVELYSMPDRGLVYRLDLPGPVSSVAFSRDGSLVAGGAREACIWDVGTGEPITSPMHHDGAVLQLEFSPDGKSLLTACGDGRARVFETTDAPGRLRFEGKPNAQQHNARAKFTPDGKSVLAITGSAELTWLDTKLGESKGHGAVSLRLFTTHNVAISPDGRWYAAAGYYGPELFSIDSDATAPRLLAHSNDVSACQFSADSKWLLSASWDRTVKLWSVETGELVGAPIAHEQMVVGAQFAPDGQHVLTYTVGGLVRLWRVPRDDRATWAVGETEGETAFRTSRDGRRAILGQFRYPYFHGRPLVGSRIVYEPATGRSAGPPVDIPDAMFETALDANGDHAAAVTRGPNGSALYVWEVATGQPRFPARSVPGDAAAVEFTPDGTRVVTVDTSAICSIFDARSGRRLFTARAQDPASTTTNLQIQFADKDTLVMIVGQLLATLDLSPQKGEGPKWRALENRGFKTAFAVSRDGRYVATAVGFFGTEDQITVRDLVTGAVSPTMHAPDIVFRLAFTPDGRRVLSGGRDTQVRCWDWSTGKLASPPCSTDDEIMDIAVSPNGRFAFAGVRWGGSSVARGKVEAWDLTSGKRVMPRILLGSQAVLSLALFGDGRHALACVTGDRPYRIDLSDLFEPDPRPIEELIRLAELASGQRVFEGDLSGLTSAEWVARYGASPTRFRVPIRWPALPQDSRRVVHYPPIVETSIGWGNIAAEALDRVRAESRTSRDGLYSAVYTLLNGDIEGYRETCRIMMREFGTSGTHEDLERTAKVCLLRDFMRADATRLAESVGAGLDSGTLPAPFAPWGFAVRALAALRNGRAEDALRWAERGGAYEMIVRAMAENALGRRETALSTLDRARGIFGGDVRAYLQRSARDPRTIMTQEGYQPDRLFAAILFVEAEAAIERDPGFPANPIARDR
jgi:WD40 repeat protein